jgi:hypothetical protein
MSEFNVATEKMSSLEERIAMLEKIADFNIEHPVIQSNSNFEELLLNYQVQMLGKLKAIREGLAAEGGDVGTIRAERDSLREANNALKKENERLNYRVRHLVKALNEEENKDNQS